MIEENKTGEQYPVSLKRLNTLTDCFFALALMLLVFLIDKPPADIKPTDGEIRQYLFSQLGTVFVYLITFINIAFFWFFSHNQGKHMIRSNGVHVWLTLITLMFTGLLPYSNALNVVFPSSFTIHLFYSAIVFFVGLAICLDWLYATHKSRLVNRSITYGEIEELIVESLVQPVAALLSIGGAFLNTFWWQLPFLLVPVAIIIINKLWSKSKTKENTFYNQTTEIPILLQDENQGRRS